MAIHLPTQIASGSNGLKLANCSMAGTLVKILFPQDVSSHGGNPYVFQLMDAFDPSARRFERSIRLRYALLAKAQLGCHPYPVARGPSRLGSSYSASD